MLKLNRNYQIFILYIHTTNKKKVDKFRATFCCKIETDITRYKKDIQEKTE